MRSVSPSCGVAPPVVNDLSRAGRFDVGLTRSVTAVHCSIAAALRFPRLRPREFTGITTAELRATVYRASDGRRDRDRESPRGIAQAMPRSSRRSVESEPLDERSVRSPGPITRRTAGMARALFAPPLRWSRSASGSGIACRHASTVTRLGVRLSSERLRALARASDTSRRSARSGSDASALRFGTHSRRCGGAQLWVCRPDRSDSSGDHSSSARAPATCSLRAAP